jgi:hypothetical protein
MRRLIFPVLRRAGAFLVIIKVHLKIQLAKITKSTTTPVVPLQRAVDLVAAGR